MAEPAPRRQHLWKFVSVGLALSIAVTVRRGWSTPMSAEAFGGFIGEAISGGIYGWLIWLLWTRAWRSVFVVVAVGVGAALILAASSRGRSGSDSSTFLRNCRATCEPQWRSGAGDPSSPAYGMSEEDVRGLCTCNCEETYRGMPADMISKLRRLDAAQIRADKALMAAIGEHSMKAMATCVPKFLRAGKGTQEPPTQRTAPRP